MSKLIVLGSVNADHVLRVPSFPRPGETLHGNGYQVIAGGKGANQALAAARLGAQVDFIACVGDDAFGASLKNDFAKEGINVEGVFVEQDIPTGIAMIQVSESGENSIVISAEANAKLSAQRVQPMSGKIYAAKYMLIQLETPIEGIKQAIKVASLATTKVILNPAPAALLDDELLAQIDIITPNETEAQVLTGIAVVDEKSAQMAADFLHLKGIAKVIITLGAKGVWLSEKPGCGRAVAGFTVVAVDTTAAGDCFNGALACALLEEQSIEQAMLFANAAAAISVTRFGAQTSIPKRNEVLKFLEEQSLNG